jgi:hypothetical protein
MSTIEPIEARFSDTDLDKPGFFKNIPNDSVGFWGVFGVRPLTKNITLDVYYLGLDRAFH